MSGHPNSEQVMAWMQKQSTACDAALAEAKSRAHEYAEAKRMYKVAHAKALLLARRDGYQSEVDDAPVAVSSVAEAGAVADVKTGEELASYVEAETLYQTAIEAARTKRAELSAIQTYVGMVKAEMDLAGRGPQRSA